MTGDRLDNDVRLVRILAGGPCVSSILRLLALMGTGPQSCVTPPRGLRSCVPCAVSSHFIRP
jgi:hypothetical protein